MNQEQMESNSLVGAFREAGLVIKGIACIVILAFGGLVTSPAVAAVKHEVQTIQWSTPQNKAAELSKTLKGVHRLLDNLPLTSTQVPATTATRNAATVPATFTAKQVDAFKSARKQLKAYHDQLKALNKDTLAQFASVKAHLLKHHLPQVILDREAKAEATYKTRMASLMTELNAANASTDNAGFQKHVLKMKAQLDKEMVKPVHEKFDPNHMPFSVAKPKHIKPRLTKKAYEATLFKRKRIQVATIGSLAGLMAGTALPSDPNDPAYVAPTDDVQITAAIKAKAAALNHDPVQIYNWVHNNIEYTPTYGSIQGSNMTLVNLRGNDIDTASLLIALLRASNIPARYVYGTIQIPIKQVENWLGGVTDPNAALNLLGQGGIPSTGLVEGGQIKYVQMEHVWVEAWINYLPARGAKSGPGNTWVPMDASFKQYTYISGMNLSQAIPFDTNSFIQNLQSTATTDPSTGSVTGIDQAYIQQQVSDYYQKAVTYANNMPTNTTIKEVLGSKTIDQNEGSILAASLPYAVISVGNRMVSIGNNLTTKFQYTITDAFGNTVLTYSAPTSDLAGKSIALSFAPATASDNQVVQSYAPAISSTLSFSGFPTSMPGYLINLVPQLTVNGTIVATGTASQLGAELQYSKGYWTPKNGWVLSQKPLISGQYQAVGLDLVGITPGRLAILQGAINTTVNNIKTDNVSHLTKDDVVGAILQTQLISYYSANDSQAVISSNVGNTVNYRVPSFGTFSTELQPHYNFGVPTSVSFAGFLMDVDHVEAINVSKTNAHNEDFAFNVAQGMALSAFENQVPEKGMGTSTYPADGLSAVKILKISAAAGQPVYTITSSNLSTAVSKLNQSSAVIQRIEDAVNAGMQVTIPQSTITSDGWTGTGYIILDPTTGAAAYEISGGANGSHLQERSTQAAESYLGIREHFDVEDIPFFQISDFTSGLLKCFGFLAGFTTFTEMTHAGCSTGNAVATAVIDYFISKFLSDFAFSLLLGPFSLIEVILLAVMITLIVEYIMDMIKSAEEWLCENTPPA